MKRGVSESKEILCKIRELELLRAESRGPGYCSDAAIRALRDLLCESRIELDRRKVELEEFTDSSEVPVAQVVR